MTKKRLALPMQFSAWWMQKSQARMTPRRGEVWLWDLGMIEKVRPALVMSVSYGDLDRADYCCTGIRDHCSSSVPETRCLPSVHIPVSTAAAAFPGNSLSRGGCPFFIRFIDFRSHRRHDLAPAYDPSCDADTLLLSFRPGLFQDMAHTESCADCTAAIARNAGAYPSGFASIRSTASSTLSTNSSPKLSFSRS